MDAGFGWILNWRMVIFILLLNLCTVESKVAKKGKARRLHSSLGYLGRSKLQVRSSTLNKDVRWKSLCNKMCHAWGLILSTGTEFAFDSGQTVKKGQTSGLNTRRTCLSVIRMLLSIYSFFFFFSLRLWAISPLRPKVQAGTVFSTWYWFTSQGQRKQDLYQVKQAEIK